MCDHIRIVAKFIGELDYFVFRQQFMEIQGCHGTGKPGIWKSIFQDGGKHREFAQTN